MVLMQAVFGAAASTFVWEPLMLQQAPWLLLMGVTGLLAHFCLTSALAEADATFVMPLEFLRLPVVALAGFLLYAESFELEILLGALIIFSGRSEEHTSELQSLMRISYAVFCLKKKNKLTTTVQSLFIKSLSD